MEGRPRITFTREGRYYVFVLAFIIGGAVLREVNLLVVLAAIMVGPLFFSWRALVMILRRMSVRRDVVTRLSVGDTLTATITLVNGRRSLPAWAFTVSDRLRPLERPVRATETGVVERPTNVDVYFPMIPAGEERSTIYRLNFTRRGRYELGPLTISTGFPFDFLRGTLSFDAPLELLVSPAVGRFTQQWRQHLDSPRMGQQRMQRRRGLADGDYYGLREWRPGDSRRWIHWRTSAKLGSLSVLQYEDLRHRELALLVDLWSPPNPTSEDDAYAEFALSFAATAVVELNGVHSHELAIAVAGSATASWASLASRLAGQEVLDFLATVDPSPQVDLAGAMRDLSRQLRPGTRLLVISTRPPAESTDERDAPLTWDILGGETEWLNVRDTRVRDFLRFDDSRGDS